MDRRAFIKRMAVSAAATGAALLAPPSLRLFAQTGREVLPAGLAAVMGGEPDAMFDRGIEALGGMRRFVKRGGTVAIKPNMSWNVVPEMGATTNPKLVKRIIEHCFNAGARRVYVFDNTLDSYQLCYSTTRIEAATKEAGGTLVPGNSRSYYQEAAVPGAEVLKSVQVHELVMESDTFINVPILKHHGSTTVTAAMKNLMGVVWDRRAYHWKGLDRCIADFPLLRRPDLNVIDAYRVMMSGGPRGTSYRADLSLKKMQILSPDIVAADTAAVRTWGAGPEDIQYIRFAAASGLGTMDLDSLSVSRIRM